ncbi:hypothetical protein SH611_13130 [Geminicoccaceae bacterium 1502E]|nr:hypothetical protein [Geminicoccaceae bacterium 1502E]
MIELRMKTLALLLLGLLAAAPLAGCDGGFFEEAGESADEAIDDVEDAVD